MSLYKCVKCPAKYKNFVDAMNCCKSKKVKLPPANETEQQFRQRLVAATHTEE